MSRAAVFIDGAYLDHLLKDEFGRPPVDFASLVNRLAGTRELLRSYYYDCLPYQSREPTPDERSRFSNRQRFHHAIGKIPRFQVRLGKLEFRGMRSGKPQFEQKRVVERELGFARPAIFAKACVQKS